MFEICDKSTVAPINELVLKILKSHECVKVHHCAWGVDCSDHHWAVQETLNGAARVLWWRAELQLLDCSPSPFRSTPRRDTLSVGKAVLQFNASGKATECSGVRTRVLATQGAAAAEVFAEVVHDRVVLWVERELREALEEPVLDELLGVREEASARALECGHFGRARVPQLVRDAEVHLHAAAAAWGVKVLTVSNWIVVNSNR